MRSLIAAPDPAWPAQFQAEAAGIRNAIGEGIVDIMHIGSTAIPGIYAKPVIDILLIAEHLEVLDAAASAMRNLGYQVMGEFGIARRRYFRKDNASAVRTHQVHGYAEGDGNIGRHVAFRDYLRAHPEAARAYSELKQRLVSLHNDASAYVKGKDAFVQEHQAIALHWAAGQILVN